MKPKRSKKKKIVCKSNDFYTPKNRVTVKFSELEETIHKYQEKGKDLFLIYDLRIPSGGIMLRAGANLIPLYKKQGVQVALYEIEEVTLTTDEKYARLKRESRF